MKAVEVRAVGEQILDALHARQIDRALDTVAPIVQRRTPFAQIDRIGAAIAAAPAATLDALLARVADLDAEGGWPLIGSALGGQLHARRAAVLVEAQRYIVRADVWYAADTIGERVPGASLVDARDPTLALLAPWRTHADRWVRRAVGVAVHLWAKRVGTEEGAAQMLALLAPLLFERDLEAVKGIGWGLKTLARHCPELVTDWLVEQFAARGDRRVHAVIVRKVQTYLGAKQRARIERALAT